MPTEIVTGNQLGLCILSQNTGAYVQINIQQYILDIIVIII